eukprot:760786-Hanusia_phi.AAC.9
MHHALHHPLHPRTVVSLHRLVHEPLDAAAHAPGEVTGSLLEADLVVLRPTPVVLMLLPLADEVLVQSDGGDAAADGGGDFAQRVGEPMADMLHQHLCPVLERLLVAVAQPADSRAERLEACPQVPHQPDGVAEDFDRAEDAVELADALLLVVLAQDVEERPDIHEGVVD